ncbi:MAG: hypothetical protein HXX08_07720 [Chloroflexi bacterium]|uniref:Uncharacterized protein n=1 Tax=Candidatus Chlorohelix allophototropha TaxID=3003348 RepID=A0A8T7M1V0_9CHLR|nr:hypothetical protein [Chloroflexota bacterium]WJW67620.1 hypothetical protein OZ401_000889 [Chloroflexota bacterium L227-S17]
MDDFGVFMLVVAWLVAIIGGPTILIFKLIRRDEDPDRRYRMVTGFKGWFIGLAAALLLYMVLPTVFVNQSADPDSMGEIQLFFILILPPICAGVVFLIFAILADRFKTQDEFPKSIEEEEGIYYR